MLQEYQRAREEAKLEIARARARLQERTEQEKLRIRQQIISQLLRVGMGQASGSEGAGAWGRRQARSAFPRAASESWDVAFGGRHWTPSASSKLCSLFLHVTLL